jgi:replicative DNA helicase
VDKAEQNQVAYSSIDSEQHALSATFQDNTLLDQLNKNLFSDSKHIEIFEIMKGIRAEGFKYDRNTLYGKTKDTEIYKIVMEIATKYCFNFDYHLKELKKCKTQRDMQTFSEGIKRRIDNPEEAIKYINKNAHRIGISKATCLDHIRDIAPDVYQYIEDKSNGRVEFFKTGFFDLDRKILPEKTDLMVIAARPSQGKSAFMTNIARYMAKFKTVAIFSIEMSEKKITERLISAEAEISITDLSKNPQRIDWKKLASATATVSNLNIYIEDTECYTLEDIRTKAMKLKKEAGRLDVIMVDYLQLMNASAYGGREREISIISSGLKRLAKDLDCLVIALSQLSRAPEMRADHRPIMSDLRDSGSIEQDSDIICFLYRDEYYHSDSEKKGIAEIIVGKNRNGATGTVELAWIGEYMKFKNLEKNKDF